MKASNTSGWSSACYIGERGKGRGATYAVLELETVGEDIGESHFAVGGQLEARAANGHGAGLSRGAEQAVLEVGALQPCRPGLEQEGWPSLPEHALYHHPHVSEVEESLSLIYLALPVVQRLRYQQYCMEARVQLP